MCKVWNISFYRENLVIFKPNLACSAPYIKRALVPRIEGNYTMKLANTKLSEFHFHVLVFFGLFDNKPNR